MRVLMIGWELPPYNSGGLGVACYGLTKAMARRAIDITFVLPQRMTVEADFLNVVFAETVTPGQSGAGTTPVSAYAQPEIAVAGGAAPQVAAPAAKRRPVTLFDQVQQYADEVEGIANEESFDVIHAHDWLSFPAGVRVKQKSGKPLVVHVHATEFNRTGGGGGSVNQAVYEVERWGMEQADRVVAVSGFIKHILVERYGIRPEKITVIYNGIAPEEYASPRDISEILRLRRQGYRIVLFVGRLTLQKGPDYFVRAAAQVVERETNVVFVMAGSGDMEHQLIEEAAARGIADRLFFTGFLRDNDWQVMYRSADVFVMPSVSEPFGLAPLEAMMHNVPVIVSRQSGVSEVLDHALKVDFWDTDALAQKIIAVLGHRSLRTMLRERGRSEAERLDWDAAAEKCIQLYNRVTT